MPEESKPTADESAKTIPSRGGCSPVTIVLCLVLVTFLSVIGSLKAPKFESALFHVETEPDMQRALAETSQCKNVTIIMTDTFGDGWEGNILHLSTYEFTLPGGYSNSVEICLPHGVYVPFCCGGISFSEVGWHLEVDGIRALSGTADYACTPQGQFELGPWQYTGKPSVSPTPAPTVSPTLSHSPTPYPSPAPTVSPTISVAPTPSCVEVVIEMMDSYGDGWNGNTLRFTDDKSVTLEGGSYGTTTICLPPGTYYPRCCGGSWASEVSWNIIIGGKIAMSGGAHLSCPVIGPLVVSTSSQDIVTTSPTRYPTPYPTPYPTTADTGCKNVVIHMSDSYSNGWEGNVLYFSPDIQFTLGQEDGYYKFVEACIPYGVYSPYCCGGENDWHVYWHIQIDGFWVAMGGADDACLPHGQFELGPWQYTDHPTESPTPAPTVSPTVSHVPTATCVEVAIEMMDSFGDGWNGNTLRFTPNIGVTLQGGSYGTTTVCLPPGTYSPTCCGGMWIGEVRWNIIVGGEIALSGGADYMCDPQGQFEVSLNDGATPPPTRKRSRRPSVAPTPSPTRTCSIPSDRLGNGVCNKGGANTPQCQWDAGDCCEETCVMHPDPAIRARCGSAGYDCKNPALVEVPPIPPGCTAKSWRIGNGVCNKGAANVAECGWDAGDCCESTCLLNSDPEIRARCGSKGYDCQDPAGSLIGV